MIDSRRCMWNHFKFLSRWSSRASVGLASDSGWNSYNEPESLQTDRCPAVRSLPCEGDEGENVQSLSQHATSTVLQRAVLDPADVARVLNIDMSAATGASGRCLENGLRTTRAGNFHHKVFLKGAIRKVRRQGGWAEAMAPQVALPHLSNRDRLARITWICRSAHSGPLFPGGPDQIPALSTTRAFVTNPAVSGRERGWRRLWLVGGRRRDPAT